MLIEIDNTRRDTMAQCPRKFYYRWERHLVGQWGSTALRYGSVVHAGLECYYLAFKENHNIQLHEILPAIAEKMTEEWEKESEGLQFYDDYKTLATAVESVATYIAYYANERMYLRILEVEHKYTLPLDVEVYLWPMLANEDVVVNFIGKIDGIVSQGTENIPEHLRSISVLEHKTTARNPHEMAKALHRTAQMIGYSYVLTQKYPDRNVLGCDANILAITPLRKRKDGSYGQPKFDFVRAPQVYTTQDYLDWKESIFMRINQIAYYRLTGKWPMEYNACFTYGKCTYTELCQQQCDKVEDINTNNFIVKPWDPRKN